MRKLIFILGFTFSITFGYGQSTKTQTPTSTKSDATEAETIEWIMNKLKQYALEGSKFTISECAITEYKQTPRTSGTTFIYDFTKVTENNGYLVFETAHNSIITWLAFDNQENDKPKYVTKTNYYQTNVNAFGEADLVKRINDALLHLKSFCSKKGKKEGEKF